MLSSLLPLLTGLVLRLTAAAKERNDASSSLSPTTSLPHSLTSKERATTENEKERENEHGTHVGSSSHGGEKEKEKRILSSSPLTVTYSARRDLSTLIIHVLTKGHEAAVAIGDAIERVVERERGKETWVKRGRNRERERQRKRERGRKRVDKKEAPLSSLFPCSSPSSRSVDPPSHLQSLSDAVILWAATDSQLPRRAATALLRGCRAVSESLQAIARGRGRDRGQRIGSAFGEAKEREKTGNRKRKREGSNHGKAESNSSLSRSPEALFGGVLSDVQTRTAAATELMEMEEERRQFERHKALLRATQWKSMVRIQLCFLVRLCRYVSFHLLIPLLRCRFSLSLSVSLISLSLSLSLSIYLSI